MDHGSFDALTRSLSGAQQGSTTRRALTRLLGSGALVAPLVAWGLRDAAAKGNHHHKHKNKRRKKAAQPGAQNPGFQCTNNNDCTGGLVCLSQHCAACTADVQCSGNLVCVSGTCQAPQPGPCNFDFECPGQICTSGACRGGEVCTQPTDCPAPLECASSPRQCLLPGMQYGLVEPGTCDPVSTTACGPITLDGQSFATTCLLGACVLLCDSFAAASACADANGVCVGSFCFERD